MKRITVTLMVLVVAICAMAQEHLSFKGIPIEGSLSTFVKILKPRGSLQLVAETIKRYFRGISRDVKLLSE